jgi:HK97 family phage major capsid protein
MDQHLEAALAELTQACTTRIDELEKKINRPPALWGDFGGQGNLAAERKALASFARSGDDSVVQNFRNSMSVGDDTAGGYVVFPALSTTMTKRLFDQSPMRRLARVITITSGSEWQEPVDMNESGATWSGERQSRPATPTPDLGLLTIPVNEIYALQPITQRLLDDSYQELGAWIEGKIADKFARSEGAACVIGDGVLKPKGFLTYPVSTDADATRAANTLQIVNSGAAAAVTADGLRDLYWAMRAPHRANARWLMASASANVIDRLKSGDGEYLWRNGMSAGVPPTLLGLPVEFSEDMPAVGASNTPVALGDWAAGFTIVDKAGIRLLRDPFTNRPNVDFYAYRRTGGSVANFDAIKLLRIPVYERVENKATADARGLVAWLETDQAHIRRLRSPHRYARSNQRVAQGN